MACQAMSHLVEGDSCWVCGPSDGKLSRTPKFLGPAGSCLFRLFGKLGIDTSNLPTGWEAGWQGSWGALCRSNAGGKKTKPLRTVGS